MEPRPGVKDAIALWFAERQQPHAYTTEGVAKALSVSEPHVRTLIRSGALPSVKIGECRRVTRTQLDAYLAALEAEGAAS